MSDYFLKTELLPLDEQCPECYGTCAEFIFCEDCGGTGFDGDEECEQCYGNGDEEIDCSYCNGIGTYEAHENESYYQHVRGLIKKRYGRFQYSIADYWFA